MRTETGQPSINRLIIIKLCKCSSVKNKLWTFMISHVSKEVLHHVQLDVSYSDIDRNKTLMICGLYRSKKGIHKIVEMNGQISSNIPSMILMWYPSSFSANILISFRDFWIPSLILRWNPLRLRKPIPYSLASTQCNIKSPYLIFVFNLPTPP